MGDLISRQAAIKIADEECFELKGIFDRIKDGLNALPSAQKHGKWIKISDRNYRCSACKSWWGVERDSVIKDFCYCPSCGAKMEEEDEAN